MSKSRVNDLRVLMVSQRMLPFIAGAETKALNLARSLLSLGCHAEIVTTRFASNLAPSEVIEGVSVRRLPMLGRLRFDTASVLTSEFPARPSQFLSTAAYIAARGRSFDIVHAHCLSATSLGAVLGAQVSNVPILVEPSHGGADGEARKIARSRSAPVLAGLLKHADHFAANSPLLADELAGLGIDRGQIAFVNNGVDLESFYPASGDERKQLRAKLNLPEGPLAIFVGQLVPRKGVKPLIEAWREVAASIKKASLVFIGKGAEVESVKREAARPGSRVIHFEAVKQVAEYLRASDVLVLPSINESFGNVIIEALACGRPVIVGRTGVALKLEIDGAAGRVIDSQDPAEITRALVETLGVPDRGASLGERGRAMVQQYDFREVAMDYVALYKSVIKRAHS